MGRIQPKRLLGGNSPWVRTEAEWDREAGHRGGNLSKLLCSGTLLCRPITCGTEHLARPRHVPARFFCSWHRDEAPPDRRHAAIVCTVIGLARGVQLPVLAEGVKTNEQLAFLSREARDEVQGYFVGRPLPIEH
jgi:hypothetical protein